MPNYCKNTLVIRGGRHEVDAFLGATRGVVRGEGSPIDFNAIRRWSRPGVGGRVAIASLLILRGA